MHSHSTSFTSPLQPRKLQGSSANETVIILIPALSVQVDYKSLVGQSYQFPSPSSSTPSAAPSFEEHVPTIEVTPGTPDSVAPPTKRGVLAVSVVVKSTPEDMTLSPSLLEFVEQVVRPTIAATVSRGDSNSDGDSEEESEEDGEGTLGKSDDAPPISFPVDVTIVFHMQPSKVCFSCNPHSRVHCIVCSPNVSFVVSFSLFSARELEGATMSPSQLSVVTFNNLYVTGCLETFTLQVLSPQVSGLKQNESESVKPTDKEALSLTLGQALVHLSRKSVLVAGKKASPGEDAALSKRQVSGERLSGGGVCVIVPHSQWWPALLVSCSAMTCADSMTSRHFAATGTELVWWSPSLAQRNSSNWCRRQREWTIVMVELVLAH